MRAFRALSRLLFGESSSSSLVPSSRLKRATRFVLSRSNLRMSPLRVKGRAFEPSPDDRATSVFIVTRLSEDAIWLLAETHVATVLRPHIHARADVTTHSINAVGLELRSKEPPPRHALIVGWPLEKDAMMSKAQELAALSTALLNPNQAAA